MNIAFPPTSLWSIMLVAAMVSGLVVAQDGGDPPKTGDDPTVEPASTPPSLDDLLEIDDPEDPDDADAMGESNRRDLEGALAEEKPEDAFRRAVEDMQESAELLGDRNSTGIGVQRLQQRIVDRLQILIDSARRQQQQQQQQQSSSSSSQSESQQDPGRQQQQQQQQQDQQGRQTQSSQQQSESGESSSQNPPPPEFADLEGGLEGAGVEWGGLPPRVRDLISQGMRDRVSDMYRSLTEAYYRRLAEEADE